MQDFYKKVYAIFCDHTILNKRAMTACQSMGYNGFKRMHRILNKEFNCLENELLNECFDKYRKVLEFEVRDYSYRPTSLKDHLAEWDAKLERDISELGKLNKEYFEKTGVECGLVKKALACMIKRYEKTGRWYRRFDEGGWLVHDCHVLDDRLHEKHKAEEGG